MRRRGNRFLRLLRHRLLVPLQRSPQAPEHTARGVMVGLGVAFTPTVGIQVYLVFLLWLLCRRLWGWDFNLLAGAVWTWTTNAVTTPPCYYAFYLTGQLMLGRWHEPAGFSVFAALWQGAALPDQSVLAAAWGALTLFFTGWGLPILVGSVPYAILAGLLGYCVTLRCLRQHRARRRERLALRRRQRRAAMA